MNKKKNFAIFLSGAVVSMILTAAFLITPFGAQTYVTLSQIFGGSKTAKLMKIERIVDEKFMGEVHTDYMTDVAARAYVGTLGDKYSSYFSKNDFQRMSENLSGDYHGIGISIEAKNNKILITSVMPKSPAEKARLCEGDYIIKVNGIQYGADKLRELTDIIKNTPVGKDIPFTIERNGMCFDTMLKIEDIELDYVVSRLLPDGIGYVRIETFGNDVAKEFKDEVNSLIKKGASSLIFDVRSNPGGVLETVVEMVDFLVGEGTITTVRQKNGSEAVYSSDSDEINLPMCVLINEASASASEIFASALKEYDKATLVGKKTFGKGVVQGVFDLGDGTGISVTIAKYFTPLGNSIDKVGVSPDVEVSLGDGVTIKDYSISNPDDTQLSEAVRVLGGK